MLKFNSYIDLRGLFIIGFSINECDVLQPKYFYPRLVLDDRHVVQFINLLALYYR
jgi:hypothetical protein